MTTTMDTEGTRAAWDAIAAGYDEYVTPAGGMALSERALGRVGPGPGIRFLDVACGSGSLGLPAARLGAEVLGVDLSPAMIERLLSRARREGLSNIDGRVMDGHALDLDDDAFDVAGSQFGVMLFPDLPRGLREMVRVTRPGGRVLMVAYGPPPEIEFLGVFLTAVQRVVPDFAGLPSDPPPLPFQVADPDRLRAVMVEAGLRDVRVEPDHERLEFSDGGQLWDWLLNSNPIPGAIVAGFDEPRREAIRRTLDGVIRERAGRDGIAVLSNRVHIAVGTK